MLKTELLAFSFCLPLLFSCASHSDRPLNNPVQIQKPQGTNYVPIYDIGFGSKQSEDGILITEITPYGNNPAKVAGLQVGDVIVSVNGKKLTNDEFYRYSFYDNRGQDVFLRINRNGQMVDCIITPLLRGYVSPIIKKIVELLSLKNRKKMSIAVIVLEAKDNSAYIDAARQHDWEESGKHLQQGNAENFLLSAFGNDNYFSLVDRLHVDKILEEYKFNMTGIVSEDARVKIGKMTGATHLFTTSFLRYPKNDSCVDLINSRLIDVESGEILAVNQESYDCKK